ncbi:hypothetical protein B0H14DRAFT_3426777 [Mycena olivaceomarginata]|nr:hypothetical protein B0H14DRAFT_3426777 [Mycena olivaceomarginata]
MTRKDYTRSTSISNENQDSRVPAASSARTPLRDRNVTTDEGGQTMSMSPSPKPESARIARLEAELQAITGGKS